MAKRQAPPLDVMLRRFQPFWVIAIAAGVFEVAVGAALGLARISNLGWVVAALGGSTTIWCIRGRRRHRAMLVRLSNNET